MTDAIGGDGRDSTKPGSSSVKKTVCHHRAGAARYSNGVWASCGVLDASEEVTVPKGQVTNHSDVNMHRCSIRSRKGKKRCNRMV